MNAAKLKAYLLAPQILSPDLLPTLREHRLSAYAYGQLPPEHRLKAQLKEDMAFTAAHHLRVTGALTPLLHTWSKAGLDLLLFKGFQLATFVYDAPWQRPYSDVDILLRPDAVAEARVLAEAQGWRVTWQRDLEMPYDRHEVLHLEHPHFPLRLDVHKLMLHVYTRRSRLQRRYTAAAWANADVQTWQDVTLHALHPYDALIMGLILGRCWSRDVWQLRAQDYLDMQTLSRRYDLSRAGLLTRAKALGCERTVGRFLQRCDAFTGVLELSPPSTLQTLQWELTHWRERRPPQLERLVMALKYRWASAQRRRRRRDTEK